MANQQHLDILKQGVEVWNQWREKHSEIRPNLRGAHLSRVDLSGANFSDSDLTETLLSGANLSESNLRRALLDGVNLSNTNLMGVVLSQANLTGADLSKTNLTGAILIGTILSHADLREADFTNSELAFTMFGDVDLSSVKGLESVHHIGSSSIGIDTFYRSGGNIPEVFLRGAGVPDAFITYAYSLVNKPIEYYSCFISYSSKDQDFAERLYTDLQAVGVRCWFATSDIKIGDNWQERIDEAIQSYDKLLLVLSKHSVISRWVEKEVEVTLAKESKQKQTILFPIRLDDSVMDSTSKWTTQLREIKNIGDFRLWKNHDEYQGAFVRLIEDLALSAAKKSDKQDRAE